MLEEVDIFATECEEFVRNARDPNGTWSQQHTALKQAAEVVGQSWSGYSWYVYAESVKSWIYKPFLGVPFSTLESFYADALNKRPRSMFDTVLGAFKMTTNAHEAYERLVREGFVCVTTDSVNNTILALSGVKNTRFLVGTYERSLNLVEQAVTALSPRMKSFYLEKYDAEIESNQHDLETFESVYRNKEELLKADRYIYIPYDKGRSSEFRFGGDKSLEISKYGDAPPHVVVLHKLEIWDQAIVKVDELSKLLRTVANYLSQIQPPTLNQPTQNQAQKESLQMPTTEQIFIGHGHSPAWRDLKDFLQDRLGLQIIEFNGEAAAGLTVPERLTQMLNTATFAFLVMTAEDEHADATTHARENVVHEVGLFQGKLGFKKAIVLVEENCAVFSNNSGLVQIRFKKDNIAAKFDDIRHVLEREGVVPPSRSTHS